MSDQAITLTSDPNQSLQISPIVDGKPLSLQLDISWSEIAGYWTMRVTDLTADEVLLDSVPLIAGRYPAANLLRQYGYLGIGSAFLINSSGDGEDYPTDATLGENYLLIWGDTA
jgi:hypothetical protein